MKTFEKLIRRVGIRCSVNLLLEQLAWSMLLAGVIASVAVLAERLLPSLLEQAHNHNGPNSFPLYL